MPCSGKKKSNGGKKRPRIEDFIKHIKNHNYQLNGETLFIQREPEKNINKDLLLRLLKGINPNSLLSKFYYLWKLEKPVKPEEEEEVEGGKVKVLRSGKRKPRKEDVKKSIVKVQSIEVDR